MSSASQTNMLGPAAERMHYRYKHARPPARGDPIADLIYAHTSPVFPPASPEEGTIPQNEGKRGRLPSPSHLPS
jgi:hypothetical protein